MIMIKLRRHQWRLFHGCTSTRLDHGLWIPPQWLQNSPVRHGSESFFTITRLAVMQLILMQLTLAPWYIREYACTSVSILATICGQKNSSNIVHRPQCYLQKSRLTLVDRVWVSSNAQYASGFNLNTNLLTNSVSLIQVVCLLTS